MDSPLHIPKLTPFAYEAVTVSSTAIGGTSTTFRDKGVTVWENRRPAIAALVTVETDAVRFRLEGTPTSSVGHALAVGDALWIEGLSNIENFKAIRVSGDANLKITYFR